VTRVVALDGDEAGFLSLLAGLEAQSEHPSPPPSGARPGRAGFTPAKVVDVNGAHPRFGITGRMPDGPLWAGNPYLAEEMGARIGRCRVAGAGGRRETVVYLGRGPEGPGRRLRCGRGAASSAAGLPPCAAAGFAAS
jgi:Cd2+/Zn2+-exporting ATPase